MKGRRHTALPLLLIGTAAALYFSLFREWFTPIYRPTDQWVFMQNAARMLEGEVLYRDFPQLTTPGISFVNFVLFQCFGPSAWIPNASLLALGLCIVWLVFITSRQVIPGGLAVLPAALFLTFAYYFNLDNVHHWYAAAANLGALAVVINERTLTRLCAAGALCGLASFFTQSMGLAQLIGLVLFLLWRWRRSHSSWRELRRSIGCVIGAFAATLLASCAYFVWIGGVSPFIYCTFIMPAKYYDAERAWNSLDTYMTGLPTLERWYHLPQLGAFLAIHALLPLVYVVFGIRYRRERLDPEAEDSLVLLAITGSMLFLGVAHAPHYLRLSSVSAPAFILLVWLIRNRMPFPWVPLTALGLGVCCIAIGYPWRIQMKPATSLDLPRGRVAFVDDQPSYELLEWLQQRTRPGEAILSAFKPDPIFLLGLRSSSEITYLSDNEFTRPEWVRNAIVNLDRDRVRFILWSSWIEYSSSYTPTQHNLTPLREYRRAHYRLTRMADLDEVWERRD